MKPFQVTCPSCQKGFMVKNPDAIGKNFRCTQCQIVFVIQPPVNPKEEEDEVPLPQSVAGTAGAAPGGVAATRGGTAPAAAPTNEGGNAPEEEEGEEYPDNEPTIAVSAYEAQKLREQLRKNLSAVATTRQNPSAGFAEPAHSPAPEEHPAFAQPGFNSRPANPQPIPRPSPPAASPAESNLLLYIVIVLALIVIGLIVVLFLK